MLPLLALSLVALVAILCPAIAALGILGARYRDLAPLVGSMIYMVFLITPVAWDRSDIGRGMVWLVELNTLCHMIDNVRRQMIGILLSERSMVETLAMAGIAVVAGEMFFRRCARPLAFWI